MIRRFLTFGQYLRDVFGEVVYKVNVDAGFTCPNRDGTLGVSGCIYCNNSAFRPSEVKSAIPIREQIQRGISYLSVRYNANKFLVYFQPYTNTYAPVERLEQLYREALSVPSVIGLTIGTRPDCVEEDKLALLSDIAQNYFILIEYGLQSIYDRSLQFILRGHDYRTFLDAVQRAQRRRIHVGAHIIAGLPTETREETLAMADKLSNINIRFLKIHQLQVVRARPWQNFTWKSNFLFSDILNISTSWSISLNACLLKLFCSGFLQWLLRISLLPQNGEKINRNYWPTSRKDLFRETLSRDPCSRD